MPTLLNRIQSGIVTGAALWIGGTGCSTGLSIDAADDADTDARTMTGDAATDARTHDANTHDAHTVVDASTRDATLTHDASVDGGLKPYPLSALACTGPDAAIWCCHNATCAVVEGTCPDNPFPYELGQPGCEGSGPFAPNPEDLNAPSGNCCYIIGSIAVEGRPLFVDHHVVVAPIVPRADWLLV